MIVDERSRQRVLVLGTGILVAGLFLLQNPFLLRPLGETYTPYTVEGPRLIINETALPMIQADGNTSFTAGPTGYVSVTDASRYVGEIPDMEGIRTIEHEGKQYVESYWLHRQLNTTTTDVRYCSMEHITSECLCLGDLDISGSAELTFECNGYAMCRDIERRRCH